MIITYALKNTVNATRKIVVVVLFPVSISITTWFPKSQSRLIRLNFLGKNINLLAMVHLTQSLPESESFAAAVNFVWTATVFNFSGSGSWKIVNPDFALPVDDILKNPRLPNRVVCFPPEVDGWATIFLLPVLDEVEICGKCNNFCVKNKHRCYAWKLMCSIVNVFSRNSFFPKFTTRVTAKVIYKNIKTYNYVISWNFVIVWF